MKPVKQTITRVSVEYGGDLEKGEPPGNCVQACVASILELELEEVPNFVHYPIDYEKKSDSLIEEFGGLWYRRMRRWLRERNLDCIAFEPNPGAIWAGYVLLTGDSPRGPWLHVVVAHYPSLEIAHDPHPDNTGLNGGLLDVVAICDPYEPGPPREDL